jgi:Spy/CpxP family protein refolding chaperone
VNGRTALAEARLVVLSLQGEEMRNVYTFAGLTFASALAFSLTAAGQTSSTESKQQASPDQSQTDSTRHMHRDRVGERLEWLSQQLNLTEDQKKQLKPILAGEFKQMRAVGEDASLTQDQKREKMKQIHEASRPQVQTILTPEQQQKFARMKEEAKERHGENKDKGQSDYQPPQ